MNRLHWGASTEKEVVFFWGGGGVGVGGSYTPLPHYQHLFKLLLVQKCLLGYLKCVRQKNGVCLTQQMCHIMILFQNVSTLKNESNQNVM